MQPASRVLQFYWTRVHRNNFTWAVPVHIVYGIRVQQGSLFLSIFIEAVYWIRIHQETLKIQERE